ncbi:MAG: complex I NDUFA9 subunit family protein [Chloroflexota bacterium]
MAVLVTGASGFLGNHITRRLVQSGRPVRGVVQNVDKARRRLSDVLDSVEIVTGDVTRMEDMRRVMKGVDAVVHLVAVPMERGGATYEAVNYQGTINVVDAAKEAGVERFINMSQNGATPDHFSRFLRSKGQAQVYVAGSGLKWTALRPSVVFGPQDEFFNAIARLVRLTPVVYPLIGGGNAEFQPVSVYDVAEAVVRSLDDDSTIGQEYGLGGPEVLTLGEIERRILRAMGTRRILIPAPVPVLRPVVWLMERTLKGSPVTTALLDLLKEPNVVPDNALVTKFGLQPRPFSGENIAYVRDTSAGQALRALLTGETVN